MISEGQARALLYECEIALGISLKDLRARLRASNDILAALWELITLNTVLQLGKGVEHEPGRNLPDVLVDSPSYGRFWIEAAHVKWPPCTVAESIRDFITWTMRELSKAGLDPHTYSLHIDPPGGGRAIDLGRENQWPNLRRDPRWRAFVEAVAARTSQIFFPLPSPFSATVEVTFFAKPQRFISSGYRSPQLAAPIDDHPVYRAIRSKGAQARRHDLREPTVLCLCSSLTTSLFRQLANNAPQVEAVIESALYDTSNWPEMVRYNRLRDTSRENRRVTGASRISAVLLASIEDRDTGLMRRDWLRHAEVRTIVNSEAAYPLTPGQLTAVRSLNFNTFPYGPQWETWGELSMAEWDDRKRLSERTEPGRGMRYSPNSDGGVRSAFRCRPLHSHVTRKDPRG